MPVNRTAYIWITANVVDGNVDKRLAEVDDRGVARLVAEPGRYYEPSDYELSAEAGLKRAEDSC
jgi:hypothetical protein